MIRAVLEANVLVSALLKRSGDGIPDQILRRADEYELALSEAILREADRVLRYLRIQRKYQLSNDEIAAYLTYLRALATMTADEPEVDVIADDPDDNAIVACALAANADYVVSGDPHLLALGSYQGVGVVRPAEFLEQLDAADAEDDPSSTSS